MKYRGIIGPLLTSLRAGTAPKASRLMGQEVKTQRGDVSVFVAVDSEQNPHLLVSPAPVTDERFRRFELKTFGISVKDWSVGSNAQQKYLDFRCVLSGNDALLRPFEAFCDDFLVDLDHGAPSPETAALRTANRWHAFWARQTSEMTLQAMRGLLGELSFLEFAIRRHGARALQSWMGPENHDHDFQSGHAIAFEVKTSSRVPYQVECNLNQLDRGLFAKLYLVCFQMRRTDSGISLLDQVEHVASSLQGDDAALALFADKLGMVGYRYEDAAVYSAQRFQVGSAEVFLVGAGFPAITVASFETPPDMRVLDVRYKVEISGLPSVALDDHSLKADLERLCS
jgi:hypothetical protein